MRINTSRSIQTANSVHARFGSWKAAKASARFFDGKFVVGDAVNGRGSPLGSSKAK